MALAIVGGAFRIYHDRPSELRGEVMFNPDDPSEGSHIRVYDMSENPAGMGLDAPMFSGPEEYIRAIKDLCEVMLADMRERRGLPVSEESGWSHFDSTDKIVR